MFVDPPYTVALPARRTVPNPAYSGYKPVRATAQSPYEYRLAMGSWESTARAARDINTFHARHPMYDIYTVQTTALRPVVPVRMK
jgi:hypothetical protein